MDRFGVSESTTGTWSDCFVVYWIWRGSWVKWCGVDVEKPRGSRIMRRTVTEQRVRHHRDCPFNSFVSEVWGIRSRWATIVSKITVRRTTFAKWTFCSDLWFEKRPQKPTCCHCDHHVGKRIPERSFVHMFLFSRAQVFVARRRVWVVEHGILQELVQQGCWLAAFRFWCVEQQLSRIYVFVESLFFHGWEGSNLGGRFVLQVAGSTVDTCSRFVFLEPTCSKNEADSELFRVQRNTCWTCVCVGAGIVSVTVDHFDGELGWVEGKRQKIVHPAGEVQQEVRSDFCSHVSAWAWWERVQNEFQGHGIHRCKETVHLVKTNEVAITVMAWKVPWGMCEPSQIWRPVPRWCDVGCFEQWLWKHIRKNFWRCLKFDRVRIATSRCWFGVCVRFGEHAGEWTVSHTRWNRRVSNVLAGCNNLHVIHRGAKLCGNRGRRQSAQFSRRIDWEQQKMPGYCTVDI